MTGGRTHPILYMPYVMAGYAVGVLMLLSGCLLAMRTIPGLPGLRLLSLALVAGLASVLLVAARLWIPAWASIILGNETLFAASLLIYAATAQVLSAPLTFLRPGTVLAVAALAADAWYTWPHPGLIARILIGSLLCGFYAAATAVLAYRHRYRLPTDSRSRLPSVPVALAVLQTLLALDYVARCLLTVIFPPANFLHLDLIQAGFTYLNLLLYVGSVGGIVWIALCSHRRELRTMADTDSLTGLLNRGAFEHLLALELQLERHAGGSTAVLLLDIDRFKSVNDSFGHPAGDEVIRRVGALLHDQIRPDDTLARYGGEEFVVMTRQSSLEQGQALAERLRQQIASLSGLPGGLKITASIGVTVSSPGDQISDLLHRSDQALYHSKSGGRNRVTAQHRVGMETAPGLA